MQLEHYLGRPWEPSGFNCWALVREIYDVELGICLPAIGIDAADFKKVGAEFKKSTARKLFIKIDQPLNYCVVTMKHGDSNHESHCGIYVLINGFGYVLHNWRGCGVVCEKIDRLSWLDLHITGFYKYNV